MQLNVTLNEEQSKRFQTIKEHLGIVSNPSVLAFLIVEEYRRLQKRQMRKVFLPNDVYRRVEQAAEKRGQTIYEYVQEITEDLLKQKQTS